MSEAETSEAEEAAEPAPEPDPLREELVGTLGDRLGDGLVDSHILSGLDVWARVATDAWADAAVAASQTLGCRYFCFLSAIDWLQSPWGRYEDAATDEPFDQVEYPSDYADVDHGVCGGETRFQVFARVYNTDRKHGITLKADVPDDSLAVGTWIGTYAGAAWHEREAAEMFGLTFMGNPDLRKLYLPTEFEGYPLRKDFPLIARQVKPWPGLVDVEPMPAQPDDAEDASSEDASSEDATAEEGGDS